MYRMLLVDRENAVWAVDSCTWGPDPARPERRIPICERKPFPEHQGVGFETLEMAQQIVQYLTLPPSELRLFRIDEGLYPTSYQRADRAVTQQELDGAKTQPWLHRMRGPRGPLIPE